MPITMSTPYEEMHRIFWQEYEKCEYWVQKDINRRGISFKTEAARKYRMGLNPKLPVVEYKGKTGNRWINNLYVTTATNRGITIGYDTVCYWETMGSFGAFIPTLYEGERYLIITPGHFWQRVCERTDYQMQGVHTAMQFLNEHLVAEKAILPPGDKDPRRQIAIHWHGGSGYGLEVCPELHIFELRTFIDENSLTGKKLYDRRKMTRNMVSENVKYAAKQLDALETLHPDASTAYIMSHIDKDKVQELCEDIHTKESKYLDMEIKKLVKGGKTEDEAISELVARQPNITYKNKYGEFVTEEDDQLIELKIRLRETEMYNSRKQSCKEMISALNEFYNERMPKQTQNMFYDIYTTSYSHAWVAVHNWVFGEYTSADPESLQPYKHRIFAKVAESVLKWAAEQEMDEDRQSGTATFVSLGFDRGFVDAFSIAVKTLNLPVEVQKETALEFLNKYIEIN